MVSKAPARNPSAAPCRTHWAPECWDSVIPNNETTCALPKTKTEHVPDTVVRSAGVNPGGLRGGGEVWTDEAN